MAIRVVCHCGRNLDVSSDRAGRQTICPICGSQVSIPAPSRGPTSRKTTLKSSFFDERKADGANPEGDVVAHQVTFGSHRPSAIPPRRRAKRPQSSVWECLLTPVNHAGFLLKFSLLAAPVAVFLLNLMQSEILSPVTGRFGRVIAAFMVLGLPLVGVAAEFLSLVVAEASRVGPRRDRFVSLSPGHIAAAVTRWTIAMAAGPIVFFLAAIWYWIRCGDRSWLDDWILLELLALGVGDFMIAVLLTSGRPLSGVSPFAVCRAVSCLQARALFVAVTGGILVALGVRLVVAALARLSIDHYWAAGRLMFLSILAMLAISSILFDLLGTWYAHLGEPLPASEEEQRPNRPIAMPSELTEPSTV